ncbi:MAG: hypothetical protein ACOCTM_01845 [Bacteroidota bacterium]
MQVSDNFDIREFVHPDVWNEYGEKSVWFVNRKLILCDQALRDRYGLTMINNWHYFHEDLWYSRKRVNSGFNLNRDIGADYSMHKLGLASDSIYKDVTADEVREDILKHEKFWLDMGLTTLESGDFAKTWVHKDTRYTGLDYIFIVEPEK